MGLIVGLGSNKSGRSSSIDLSNYYTKSEVDNLVFSGDYNDLTNVPELDLSVFELVETLPTENINLSKVYLTKDTEASTDELSVYKLNKYIDGAWSILDSYRTSIDLSGYVEKETGKGLFSGSYNDLTNQPNLDLYVTLTTTQTISGNKTFTNALLIQGDGHIQSTADSGAIRLFGGTTQQKGASFIFHGKDYSDDYWKGSFNIIAHNGTTYKELTGKPDGTLTWDGKSLVTADSLNNYVTLTTDLTISGSKTFSKDIVLKSSTGDSQGVFRTNGNNELIISDGKAIYFRNTNEKIATTPNGFKLEFTNLSGTETNALKPETNEGLNLGLSSYLFNNIYGKTIYLNGKLVVTQEDILPVKGTCPSELTSTTISSGIYQVSGTYTGCPTEFNGKNIFGTFIQYPGTYKVQVLMVSVNDDTECYTYTRRYVVSNSAFTNWTIYETPEHASDTYVKKSSVSTKELVFIKEDGSTETIKSIVEV